MNAIIEFFADRQLVSYLAALLAGIAAGGVAALIVAHRRTGSAGSLPQLAGDEQSCAGEQSSTKEQDAEPGKQEFYGHSIAGFFQTTLQGKVLLANDTCARLLGYESPDDLISSITDVATQLYVNPWQRQEVINLLWERKLTGTLEVPFYRKDHSIAWLQLCSQAVCDSAGNILYIAGSFVDVSALRGMVEKAWREERRLRKVLEVSQQKTQSVREFLGVLMEAVLSVNESRCGYISYYREADQEFVLHGWFHAGQTGGSEQEWQEEKNWLWDEVIRRRAAVIVNDFSSLTAELFAQPQEFLLYRALTIPVFCDGQIVAIVGIANKETDYTDEDVQQLTLTMDALWKIVERKQAEEQLSQQREMLEGLVKQRTRALWDANQELSALNENLHNSNQRLQDEMACRRQAQEELLVREEQYRVTTNLLTEPIDEGGGLLSVILRDALALVKAPGGYIGLENENGKTFSIRHAFGTAEDLSMAPFALGSGMYGQMCRLADVLVVDDYREYPFRIDDPRMGKVTTIIMIPLKQEGRVIGALCASWNDTVHQLRPQDQEILRQFGDLASIALEKARVQHQIFYKNQLLQALAATTRALIGQLNLDEALEYILDQTLLLMELKDGFLLLFTEEEDHVHVKSARGRFQAAAGIWPMVGARHNGAIGEVVRTHKLFYIENYAQWPQRSDDPIVAEATVMMQAPLIVDDEIIGVIGLAAFGEEYLADKERLDILEQYAIVASLAIKNAMAHQKVLQVAYSDMLTGLPNRAGLHRYLSDRFKDGAAAQGVLFLIDLDNLKAVNDTFGHSAGDNVIVRVGRYIAEVLPDVFVAHIGADEFVVDRPGPCSAAEIGQLADRLVAAIDQDYTLLNQRVRLSASVGITVYPKDAASVEEILRNADNAMYAAKRAGKNCWRFYEPQMLKDAYDKMVMTNALRQALEDGELYLEYQPQIDLKSGRVAGFEALLRWLSPVHGQVSPGRFIPLAEDSALIQPIGQWVLEEACRFARQLADMGHKEIHIAVNVSSRQIMAESFVQIVQTCMEKTGIQPRQLELEITESLLIDLLEESTRKLETLHAMGVNFSLDDFGTGFSSLTYLRILPVRKLKIDKSFIDEVQGGMQGDLVGSIINMAHVLGLTVVAEGVEREEQLLKLLTLQCDSVQGYIFSRPISKEAAIKFLQ